MKHEALAFDFAADPALSWRGSATELAALNAEKRQLEAASDVLKLLAAQVQALEAALADTARKLKERGFGAGPAGHRPGGQRGGAVCPA